MNTPSPFVTANPAYDFEAPIDKTSAQLAKDIAELIVANKDILFYQDPKLEGEALKQFQKEKDEASADFGIDVMRLITASDLPADYATAPIERFIATLTTLKMYISGTVRQYDDEILSRLMGVRSPRTGRFADDCSTVGQKVLKLNEIRETTGGNDNDYFNPQQ